MRRWLKNKLPSHETFKNHRRLQWLGKRLHDPNLWHLNRHSTARAVAAGLFVTFTPIPLQIIMSAVAAVLVRANLPITVLLSVINNPFTFVPINYFIYRFGSFVLQGTIAHNGFKEFAWKLDSIQSAWSSFLMWLPQFGQSYFLGLGIVLIGSVTLGYWLVLLGWRIDVLYRWRQRRKKRSK